MPPLRLTLWALPGLASVAVAAIVLRHVWAQRRERGAFALMALAALSGWWALTQALILLAGDLETQVALAKLQYLGVAGAPLAWFCFALVYTGSGERLRGPLALVAVLPAATLALAFTNERHRLLWIEVMPWEGVGPGISVVHGAWFFVYRWYAYGLIVMATAVTAWHLAQSPRHRARLALVVLAPLVVLLPNVVYLSSPQAGALLDLTPTGLVVANAVMAWGVLRGGRLTMAPVARSLVVEEMRDPVVVLDRRGNIVDVNRAATEMLGISADGDVPVALGTAWAMRGEKAGRRRDEIVLNGPDGLLRTYEMTSAALGPRAGVGTSVMVLRDVTDRIRVERQLADAAAELERLANTDPLTGLPNRRHFLDVLEGEIERAERYERPLSLILLDLDHFKSVNDRFGHAAGDGVLRSAARTLRDASRDTDLPARIGGEELAFLLPETGLDGARTMAERLREGIRAVPHLSPAGASFRVSASLGIATLQGPGVTVGDFLHAADTALYAAKDRGRNRVEVWTPTETSAT